MDKLNPQTCWPLEKKIDAAISMLRALEPDALAQDPRGFHVGFSGGKDSIVAFDLDVCATPANAKAATFFTKEQDGLAQQWSGKCWMNPPYGRTIKEWMRKACAEIDRGAILIACLVPARTDTAWWHDYAMRGEIRFIRGRLKFMCDGQKLDSAPFASALVIFRRGETRNPAEPQQGLLPL